MLRWKISYKLLFCVFAAILFVLYWFYSWDLRTKTDLQQKNNDVFDRNPLEVEFYQSVCFQARLQPRLDKLLENLEIWSTTEQADCLETYKKFISMYSVELQTAKLRFKPEMEHKVKSWLGNKTDLYEEAQSQAIFTLHDHYNHRHTVYNALRSKRPMSGAHQPDKMFVSEPSDDEKSKCDFCHPLEKTAEDSFGRIQGKYSVSAANVFKVAKWHGLFITKRHNIFNMSEVEFLDLFNTSLKWIKAVNSEDHSAKYPVLFWDMFPHAGASQVHVHVHGILGARTYPGQFGDMLSAVKEFRDKESANYWNSIFQIHETLGLSFNYKKAIALAPLVPHRSHEVWLIALEPCTELFQLLYYTIRMYQDVLGQFCYSMGAALPAADSHDIKLDHSLPAVIEIGTRGDCSSPVNDMSSVELYLFNNVNTDPYLTISKLQKYVETVSAKDKPTEEEMTKYVENFTSQSVNR